MKNHNLEFVTSVAVISLVSVCAFLVLKWRLKEPPLLIPNPLVVAAPRRARTVAATPTPMLRMPFRLALLP